MNTATPVTSASPQVNLDNGLVWIQGGGMSPDFGGPVDRPSALMPPGDGLEPIAAHAERRPDKVAIVDGDVTLTYAELIDRVNGLMARMRDTVPSDAVVACVIHNGAAAITAMVATITSGRTLVPIDAGHPMERQTALFAASGASVVLLAEGAEVNDSFIPPEISRIYFDVTKPTGAAAVPTVKANELRPAIVMFTSGSTGRPKGLASSIRPGQIQRFVDKFHLNESDVFISLASLSQTGAADMLALVVGATVRVVDVKRRGIMEVLRVMGEEGVTFLSFVPSVLRTLMTIPGIEKALRHLRILDLHGESILASDIAQLREKLPKDCCISISYGSTEAGGVFSWFVRDEAINGPAAPAGYLIEGKQAAIVNEEGRSVVPGEVGELIVRGRMVLGSWQDGKLSGSRFMQDPDDPDSRIYGMGDLVRQREDGLFEILGRRDRQIKIRGLWADLGEIETALRASDGVLDAVVMVRKHEGDSDTLAAFVTQADKSVVIDKGALRRHIVATVAEHMAPAEIQVLEEIPRLANYKPDLTRLNALLTKG